MIMNLNSNRHRDTKKGSSRRNLALNDQNISANASPNRKNQPRKKREALYVRDKQFKAVDFYTREMFLVKGQITIPKPSPTVHIVPPTFDCYGYLVDFYNPEFFGNGSGRGIDEAKYFSIIRKCNKVVQTANCRKKWIENSPNPKLFSRLLYLSMILVFAAFAFLEYLTLQGKVQANMWFPLGAAACGGVAALISLSVFISLYFYARDVPPTEADVFKKLSQALDEVNADGCLAAGYEWKTSSRYFWLEVHRKQQSASNVPTKQLPTIRHPEEIREVDARYELSGSNVREGIQEPPGQ